MLHMMFKLRLCAEKPGGDQRGFNFMATITERVKFRDGSEAIESDLAIA